MTLVSDLEQPCSDVLTCLQHLFLRESLVNLFSRSGYGIAVYKSFWENNKIALKREIKKKKQNTYERSKIWTNPKRFLNKFVCHLYIKSTKKT